MRSGTYNSKKILATCALITCVLVLVCPGCKESGPDKDKAEFEIDRSHVLGPVTVHVRVDKSKLTIAQTLLLELVAAVEPGYELQMPQVGAVLENFGIIDWDNPGDKLDENNNVIKIYRYKLEPFLSGNYQLPPFTFEFQDVNNAEGKKYELVTEPVDIEVTSLLGEQRSELVIADIEDVVEMPANSSYFRAWTLGIVAVFALAVAALIYVRRKRIKELVRIFTPAHELAYQRLRDLVREDLIKAGKIKEFYERISNILRYYIEHRFELRAPERTTEEFLNELAVTDVLSGSDKEDLGEFLKHCDLVKFAKHSPTDEQIQRTFDMVKEFIEKTKSDERKVDVTDMSENKDTVEIGSV